MPTGIEHADGQQQQGPPAPSPLPPTPGPLPWAVSVHETSVVEPLTPLQQPVLLTALDALHGSFLIPQLYYFQRPSDLLPEAGPAPPPSEAFMPAARLCEALQHTLDLFPVLAGRLLERPDPERPQVLPAPGGGAVFIQASAEFTMQQLLTCRFPGIPSGLAPGRRSRPLVTTTAAPDGGFPALLVVQLTRLACGAVVLDVEVDHIVGDAAAMVQVARTLAAAARGGAAAAAAEVVAAPSMDRSCLSSLRLGSGTQDTDAPGWRPPPYVVRPPPAAPPAHPPAAALTSLRFSRAQLQRLKARVLADPGLLGEEPHVPYLSTNDVLCAVLWRGITRAQRPALGGSSVFTFSTDSRAALQLPGSFFGNAVTHAAASAPAARLLAGSLLAASKRIRLAAAAAADPGAARSTVHWMETHASALDVHTGDNLTVLATSWCKFRIHDVDFGHGPPVWAGLPSLQVSDLPPEWRAWVLVFPDGRGGVEVCLKLDEGSLALLLIDPELQL